MKPLTGVIPAIVTPMSRDGAIDEASLRSLVAFERDEGADGMLILGLSGEGVMLTARGARTRHRHCRSRGWRHAAAGWLQRRLNRRRSDIGGWCCRQGRRRGDGGTIHAYQGRPPTMLVVITMRCQRRLATAM